MKKIILFLIILTITLAGCIVTNTLRELPLMPQYDRPVVSESGFIGGIDGIKVHTLNPLPAETLRKNIDFEPVLGLQNRGEAEAIGTACIKGLSIDGFSNWDGCQCDIFQLQGYKAYKDAAPEIGEQEKLFFGPFTPLEEGAYDIAVSTKYLYINKAFIKACNKEDIYDTSGGCQVSSGLSKINLIRKPVSSAPVQVDKVTQSFVPRTDGSNDLIFEVNIINKGQGKMISIEDVDADENVACQYSGKDPIIKVWIVNPPGLSGQYACSDVKLEFGSGTSVCEVTNVPAQDLSKEGSENTWIEIRHAYELDSSVHFEVK